LASQKKISARGGSEVPEMSGFIRRRIPSLQAGPTLWKEKNETTAVGGKKKKKP